MLVLRYSLCVLVLASQHVATDATVWCGFTYSFLGRKRESISASPVQQASQEAMLFLLSPFQRVCACCSNGNVWQAGYGKVHPQICDRSCWQDWCESVSLVAVALVTLGGPEMWQLRAPPFFLPCTNLEALVSRPTLPASEAVQESVAGCLPSCSTALRFAAAKPAGRSAGWMENILWDLSKINS